MSGWLPGFLIALAPLLVLVALLILGRYPGEAALERCRRALILLLRGTSVGPITGSSCFRSPGFVHSGRLIADGLAGRGPP